MSDRSYQDHWDNHLDISFDGALKPFLGNGMRWLPWIGKDFSKSTGKILIAGESHYTNEPDSLKVADKKAELHGNEFSTRQVMAEYPLEGYEAGWLKNNPTFDNLHRTLLKTDLLEPADMDKRGRLWDQFAYYNIVQRVMDYGKGRPKERPLNDDFDNGWRLFVRLVGLIHPKTCVFIGVQASNTFNDAMRNMGIQYTPVEWGDFMNGVYKRDGGSVTIEGETTSLFFMKHTSKFFSWELWNDSLEKIMPDTMANIRNVVLNEEIPKQEPRASLPVDKSTSRNQ